MKVMRRIIIIILSLLAVILLVDLIPRLINPIQRPNRMLRNYILKITPLGTSMDDVIELINSSDDWGSAHVRDFGLDPKYPTGPRRTHLEIPRIGEKTVSTNIGSYHSLRDVFFLMRVGVSVFWVFDSDNNLIEVHIWRVGHI